jgi:hypothetical protein
VFDVKDRWSRITDRRQWAARRATLVAKGRATKEVWFPSTPLEGGTTAATKAGRATKSSATKASGATRKANGTARKTAAKKSAATKATAKKTATKKTAAKKTAAGKAASSGGS